MAKLQGLRALRRSIRVRFLESHFQIPGARVSKYMDACGPPHPTRKACSFATTHWSVVLAAANSQDPGSAEAIATVCRGYWQPVYAFIRRRVDNPHDAQDLTQGFFAHLLADRSFQRADQDKGRFRSFLLGAVKHYLADEQDRVNARKRGGGVTFVPFDATLAELRYDPVNFTLPTPEAHFDRGWALALLDRALG